MDWFLYDNSLRHERVKRLAQIRPLDLIGFLKHFFNTLEIWLEAGMQGKINLRFINVDSIYSELDEALCKVLLA